MSVTLKWVSDYKFQATTEDGFVLGVDSMGDSAPCPTSILLAALGACSGSDVVHILKEKGCNIESLENYVTYTLTSEEPRLYESANLHFIIKGTDIEKDEALNVANEVVSNHCHVCLMVQPTVNITCSVEIGDKM